MTVNELLKENKKYKKCLEWYADSLMWYPSYSERIVCIKAHEDKGKKARECLNE